MRELPIPPFFDPTRVGEVWRVPYQERADEAARWAAGHGVRRAAEDRLRICLVAVDVQNTFCIPGFELFVGGRSGVGAVDDNRRLCEFIYRNLGSITRVVPTMDTHRAMQIFHPVHLVNERGEHPAPFTLVSVEDIERGVWRFNEAIAPSLALDPGYAQRQLLHYTRAMAASGKYALTIWPYHSMLGGIGHALVAAVEEAIFFHAIARAEPARLPGQGRQSADRALFGDRPGGHPRPRGRDDRRAQPCAGRRAASVRRRDHRRAGEEPLRRLDYRGPAGGGRARDLSLAPHVYLLEDCTSPVVVPGVIDYTEQADAAFRRFAEAGFHVVQSTEPLVSWPGLQAAAAA